MSEIYRAGAVWTGMEFVFHSALVIANGKVQAVSNERSEGEIDLGPDSVILPGLVNSHVHLDLSFARIDPTTDFVGWIKEVIRHRQELSPKLTLDAIRFGVRESLQAGVTTLGDISPDGASWEILEEEGMGGIIYFECLGLTPERAEGSISRFEDWLLQHQATQAIQPGISPHAPQTTSRKIYEYADLCGLPVATHLGETSGEIQFLADRSGPFSDLLRGMRIDPSLCGFKDCGDVLHLLSHARRVGWIHTNFGKYPSRRGHYRVHCPATHAYFSREGNPLDQPEFSPESWVIATDGRSSSPNLDLWSQARMVADMRPGLEPASILKMITSQPAKMMGVENRVGALVPDLAADFLVARLHSPIRNSPDVARKILSEVNGFESVWIGGAKRI